MLSDKSTKTAIPKSSMSQGKPARSDRSSPKTNNKRNDPLKNETSLKEAIDSLWMGLISLILMVARFLNSACEIIADFIVKLYRICLFCYRKPKHAKELVVTTVHLIRVSYDAEIWTWSDIWEVLKSHLIAPMTRPQKIK